MPTVDEICNDKMQRSIDAFEEAMLLYNANRFNGSANRLYYSAFYAVSALVFKTSGRFSKTHSGLKSIFSELFIKSKKMDIQFAIIYANLFEMRQEADYSDFLVLDHKDLEPLIEQTQQLIAEIKNLIE